MENRFDTDEQLRKLLGEFEAIPDSGSFDAILEKMNRKKKRRAFMILFFTGFIVLSVIALPLIIRFYSIPTAPVNQNKSSVQPEISTYSAPEPGSMPDASTKTTLQAPVAILPEADNGAEQIVKTNPGSGLVTATLSRKTESRKNNSLSQSEKHDRKSENKHTQASGPDFTENTGTMKSDVPEPGRKEELMNSSAYTFITTEPMFINPVLISPVIDPDQPEMNASLREISPAIVFLAPEKKKTISFYVGAQVSPAFNSFTFAKNPDMDQVYNTYGTNFPDVYLKSKKEDGHLRFDLSYGIKTGVRIKDKYEIMAGIGYQSLTEKGKLHPQPSSTVTPDPNSGIMYNNILGTSGLIKNTFRYTTYSLEVNRIFRSNKFLAFKSGLSTYGSHYSGLTYFLPAGTNHYDLIYKGPEKLSPWLLTFKAKAGLVFNANRRLQLHISPGVFYSPTSIFKKDYVIRQRPFGFDMECMVLFRL